MSEYIKIIISIFSVLVPGILTILGLLSKYIKSEKARKRIETITFWTLEIKKYIEQAEMLIDKTGQEKKAFVLNKVKDESAKNGFTFNENKVSEIIENIISMTKNVNNKYHELPKVVKLVDSNSKEIVKLMQKGK